MGLPIWRDPDEKRTSSHQNGTKSDATAHARSAIRRQPPIHSRRMPRASASSSSRSAMWDAPRVQRSIFALLERPSAMRRGSAGNVPPVSTLLESVSAPMRLPPPAPEAGSFRERVRARVRRMQQNFDAQRPSASTSTARLPSPAASLSDEPEQHTVLTSSWPSSRRTASRSSQTHRSRPDSRDGGARRNPRAPLSENYRSQDPLYGQQASESQSRLSRSHPLSNSWGPDSPVNGLGDRNRSPSPTLLDRWDIMRSTITPDDTLPSAESSAASTVASQSFGSQSFSSSDTPITDQDGDSSEDSQRIAFHRNGSDSASSLDPADLVCMEEDIANTEVFAEEMYYREMGHIEGQRRIEAHQRLHDRYGNRFALAAEPARIDIGFRLIEEALETEDGRQRVWQTLHNAPEEMQHLEAVLAAGRRNGIPRPENSRPSLRANQASNERENPSHPSPSIPPPTAIRASLPLSQTPPPTAQSRHRRPQSDSRFDMNIVTSRDAPEAYPVSPPSTGFRRLSPERLEGDLLAGDVIVNTGINDDSSSSHAGFDVSDLDSVRRIVERLAARDDVPEEWWMSMGLNLSRTRPHMQRSPALLSNTSSPSPSSILRDAVPPPPRTSHPPLSPHHHVSMGLVPAIETRIPSPLRRSHGR